MADEFHSKSALDEANNDKNDDSNLPKQKMQDQIQEILLELRVSYQEHTTVGTRLAALESELPDPTVNSSTVTPAPPLNVSQPHQDFTIASHYQNLTTTHNHQFAQIPFKMDIP